MFTKFSSIFEFEFKRNEAGRSRWFPGVNYVQCAMIWPENLQGIVVNYFQDNKAINSSCDLQQKESLNLKQKKVTPTRIPAIHYLWADEDILFVPSP